MLNEEIGGIPMENNLPKYGVFPAIKQDGLDSIKIKLGQLKQSIKEIETFDSKQRASELVEGIKELARHEIEASETITKKLDSKVDMLEIDVRALQDSMKSFKLDFETIKIAQQQKHQEPEAEEPELNEAELIKPEPELQPVISEADELQNLLLEDIKKGAFKGTRGYAPSNRGKVERTLEKLKNSGKIIKEGKGFKAVQ